MPSLASHKEALALKLLLIGDSGTGKTSALCSLAEAGYHIRILDLDNGLDSLAFFAAQAGVLDKIDFKPIPMDKYKASQAGPILDGRPKAYMEAMKALDKWEDDSNPAEWDDNTIFVLDSLTRLGDAAYEWARSVNPGIQDKRQWYSTAQESVTRVISALVSPNFKPNVIVISHVNYSEFTDGVTKGYPTAIGSALGRKLPAYFNTMLLAETSGSGEKVRRTIRTVPTAMIDLKNPAPTVLEKTYPLATGLAQIFHQLKEKSK